MQIGFYRRSHNGFRCAPDVDRKLDPISNGGLVPGDGIRTKPITRQSTVPICETTIGLAPAAARSRRVTLQPQRQPDRLEGAAVRMAVRQDLVAVAAYGEIRVAAIMCRAARPVFVLPGPLQVPRSKRGEEYLRVRMPAVESPVGHFQAACVSPLARGRSASHASISDSDHRTARVLILNGSGNWPARIIR